MRRLHELRRLDEVPAYSEALRTLVHLDLPESQAESLLGDILEHRRTLAGALGRDPGTVVAATDFLSNVERLLINPKVVEMNEFEATERSAITDSLTGLYNRRLFHSAIRREVRRSRRYRQTFSLLMLDLDRFKDVNDRHGHVHGDMVLQRVAALIRRTLREADVACRYGGEEFAVIFPQTDRLGAWIVAERVRRLVREAFTELPTGGQEIRMTVSGGISCFPDDGAEPSALIERADETLYHAKHSGRDRVCLHPDERRRAVRFPARSRSRVSILGEDGSVAGRGIDFSTWGALVETSARLEAAGPVRLVLTGPPSEDSPAETIVEARVVRVDPIDAGTGPTLVGLAFLEALPEPLLLHQVVRGALTGPAGGGQA